MPRQTFLGELEHMVLAAALRLGDRAYGAAIIREIARVAERGVPSGSLSVTLDRLEEKGLIRSRLADPEPERGGRPRRYVAVTATGRKALRATRAAMLELWKGIETRLEG